MSETNNTSSPIRQITETLQKTAKQEPGDFSFELQPKLIPILSGAVAQLLTASEYASAEQAQQLLENTKVQGRIRDAVYDTTSSDSEGAARFLRELKAVIVGEQIALAARDNNDSDLRVLIPQIIGVLQATSETDPIRDEELAYLDARGGKPFEIAEHYFVSAMNRSNVTENPMAFLQARSWMRRRLKMLEGDIEGREVEKAYSLKARIVRANEMGGELGWLHATRYDTGQSSCYVEPEMFCYLRDEKFEGAARNAWAAAREFVRKERHRQHFAHLSMEDVAKRLEVAELRWSVEIGSGRDMLKDESVGAAMAVAFVSVLTDLPYNSEVLLTARTDENGLFGAIDFADVKVKNTIEQRDKRGRSLVQTVLVHEDQEYSDAGDFVKKVGDIATALKFTSGRLQRILQFLRDETSVVLRDARSRIGNSIESVAKLEQLFVPVRVARGLRPKLADHEYHEIERLQAAGERDAWNRVVERRLSFQNEEFNQGVPGMSNRDRTIPTRVTESWDVIRLSTDTRFVMLGDPGFGKTTLFWRELYWRNGVAEEKLFAGETRPEEMQFAVFVRAAELASIAVKKSTPSQRELLYYLHARHGIEGEWLKEWLDTAIQDGRCLVLLDGYDEVASGQRDAFTKTVEDLKSVYLSSRLAGYTKAPFPVNGQNEVEILAYTYPQKVEEAVQKWFGTTREHADRLWGYIQAQPNLQGLLCNPLLLRFACNAAEREYRVGRTELTWQNRTDLFHSFVENLFTQANECFDRDPETHEINKRRFQELDASALRRLIEYLAMHLWRADPQRSLFERRLLENAYYQVLKQEAPMIEMLKESMNRMTPPFGCDDLYPIGLLVPTYNDPGSPAMFNLRSIGEYLAACGFKEALEGGWLAEGECDKFYAELDRLAWLPDAQPVFLFLSGVLEDPVRLIKTIRKSKEDDDLGRHRLALALQCVVEATQRLPE